MMQRFKSSSIKYAAVFATLGLLGACSNSSDDDDQFGGSTGSTGSGNTGNVSTGNTGNTGASNTGNGGTGNTGNTGTGNTGNVLSSGGRVSTGGTSSTGGNISTSACLGVPDSGDVNGDAGGACGGLEYEAEAVGVDMFIMQDRSISMLNCVGDSGGSSDDICGDENNTRWAALKSAMQRFVEQSMGKDLQMGINFFPDDKMDCDVNTYATPEVEIGPVDSAGPEIIDAIESNQPNALTPTLPALQGAILHAQAWASKHPGRATVVVLVTDGYPTQCQSPISIQDIQNVAAQGFASSPPVRTFVIGLSAGFNLDGIAREGGTNKAYLVDAANSEVVDGLVTAFGNITGSKSTCRFEVPKPRNPEDEAVDPDKVQLRYTPATGGTQQIPRLGSAADCDGSPNGGWFYDDPATHSTISVCPCTCSNFGAGKIELVTGCTPIIGPLH
jgi:hypothetical protein